MYICVYIYMCMYILNIMNTNDIIMYMEINSII